MTISYELAKELKDVGWPQRRSEEHYGDAIEYPSLSELIAACIEKTGRFSLHYNGRRPSAFCWEADWGPGGFVYHHAVGATPEEAVARLWLELRKHELFNKSE